MTARVFDAGPGYRGKIALVCAAIVAGGLFLAIKPEEALDNSIGRLLGVGGARTAGIAMIIVAGLAGAVVGAQLALRRPTLVCDDHGLAVDVPGAPLGRVAWRDLAAVGTFEMMGQRCLVLVPTELERRVAALAPLRRKLVELNGRMFGVHFAVAERSLGASVEEVIAEIARRAPHVARPA